MKSAPALAPWQLSDRYRSHSLYNCREFPDPPRTCKPLRSCFVRLFGTDAYLRPPVSPLIGALPLLFSLLNLGVRTEGSLPSFARGWAVGDKRDCC
jgi:hypothetical protein